MKATIDITGEQVKEYLTRFLVQNEVNVSEFLSLEAIEQDGSTYELGIDETNVFRVGVELGGRVIVTCIDCDEPAYSKGRCKTHYKNHWNQEKREKQKKETSQSAS